MRKRRIYQVNNSQKAMCVLRVKGCCYSVVSNSLRPHGLQYARASISFTISWTLLKLMSIEWVMPSNHLVPFPSCSQSFPASVCQHQPFQCVNGRFALSMLCVHNYRKLAVREEKKEITLSFLSASVFTCC